MVKIFFNTEAMLNDFELFDIREKSIDDFFEHFSHEYHKRENRTFVDFRENRFTIFLKLRFCERLLYQMLSHECHQV